MIAYIAYIKFVCRQGNANNDMWLLLGSCVGFNDIIIVSMKITLTTTQKRFEAKHANATHCDNVKAKFIVLDLVDENDMMCV